MRFEVHVPESRERDVAHAVADATGLELQQVFDHLRGFLRSEVELALDGLRRDPEQQREFAEFVDYVERCVQRQTAPVGGAAR